MSTENTFTVGQFLAAVELKPFFDKLQAGAGEDLLDALASNSHVPHHLAQLLCIDVNRLLDMPAHELLDAVTELVGKVPAMATYVNGRVAASLARLADRCTLLARHFSTEAAGKAGGTAEG